MKSSRRIVMAVIVPACTALVVALAVSGCGGTSHSASAQSPACLPTTLNNSAKLTGVPVDVSPAPGTDTANPHTQISFLGVPATAIHQVSVTGAHSGEHPGQLRGYSQGDGASFLPNTPFQSGEQVTVHALIDDGPSQSGGGRHVVFSFQVDTPYPTGGVPEFPNPTAAPSEYESFATLPGVQAPTLTVTTPDQDPAAGDIFTSNGPGPGRYGALIYTPAGQLVWFDQLPSGIAAEDVNVQRYEGHNDLTFWQGRVLSLGYGDGEDVVMSSRYQTIVKVHAGNGLQADLHDFQIGPGGVAYITAYNPIRCDLSSAEGGPRAGVILDNAVQEIDMRTGLVRWEWHSLDHVAVAESENSPSQSSPWDWFHLNSIDPEPDGDIFISARNTWAGYQLEGGSGKVLWRLGGEKSSFAMGPGTTTAYQHDGRVLPDGEVTFFDDGSNPRVQAQSRGVRIALDFSSHRASLSAAYTHPTPPLSAASQGNMQTLPGGAVLIGFGGVPEISEFTPSGSLLFDAHLPYNMIFYRSYRHPWSARPSDPPVVLASLNDTSEETIVHMSWNGATEVASWRVLAGPRPDSLQDSITVPCSGFESSAILPRKYAYAAVQALSASGQVLGSSRASKVIGYEAALAQSRGSAPR